VLVVEDATDEEVPELRQVGAAFGLRIEAGKPLGPS
jgi:hypothetical protein